MPFVRNVAGLTGGVSQQPEVRIYDSQGKKMENCWPSNVNGLMKRPPVELITPLAALGDDAFIHFIDRGDGEEQYFFVSSLADAYVVDLQGNTYNVIDSDAGSYYKTNNAISKLKAYTVADTTFIVNNTVVPAMSDTLSENRYSTRYFGMAVIKQGVFGKTYRILIDNIIASEFTVPDGSDPSHQLQTDAAYIANQLFTNWNYTAVTGKRIQPLLYENLVVIEWIPGTSTPLDAKILDVTDGFNNNAALGIQREVKLFSDLPARAPYGFTVQVNASGISEAIQGNGYWVRFVNKEADLGFSASLPSPKIGGGEWMEWVGRGASYNDIDGTTMPRILTRNPDSTWSIGPSDNWGSRTVGDLDTAPDPGFIGKPIRHIGVFKDRLYLAAEENMVFSENGNYFNFFPTSIATLLDGDPIDVTVAQDKVNIIRHAVGFNERLMLFSDKQQLMVTSQGALTNQTIDIRPTTTFACSRTCKPDISGANIYFSNDTNGWTEVREYFVSDNEFDDAANITAHVPYYIPKGPRVLTASNNARSVAVLTEERNSMFLYNFLFNGNQKVQSAWHKFVMPGKNIINAHFVDSTLYIFYRMQSIGTKAYFAKIDISEDFRDPGTEFKVSLDQRLISTNPLVDVDYDDFNNETTYTVPYLFTDPNNGIRVVTAPGGPIPYANLVDSEFVTQGISAGFTIIKVFGDYTGQPVYIGEAYDAVFEFSRFALKDDKGNAVTGGKTQIYRMWVNHDKSGTYQIEVNRERETPRVTPFGRIMGSVSSVFGEVSLNTGKMEVFIGANNENLTVVFRNKDHMPSNIQFIEYEGVIYQRSQYV